MSAPPTQPTTPERPRSGVRTRSQSRGSASEVGSIPEDLPELVGDNVDMEVANPGQEDPNAIEVVAETHEPPDKKEEKQEQKKEAKSILRSRTNTGDSKKLPRAKKEESKKEVPKKEESRATSVKRKRSSKEDEKKTTRARPRARRKKTTNTSEEDTDSQPRKRVTRRYTKSSATSESEESSHHRKKSRKRKPSSTTNTSDSDETSDDSLTSSRSRMTTVTSDSEEEPKTDKKKLKKKKPKKKRRKSVKNSEEESDEEYEYLEHDPDYKHLPESAEMQILKLYNRQNLLIEKLAKDNITARERKKIRDKITKLNDTLPYRIEKFRMKAKAEAEREMEKQMGKSFAGKFYEDMVVRSQTVKDEIDLDFQMYKKTNKERKANKKYTFGWDLHRERGKPDREIYASHYNVVKDRFKSGTLVVEDPIPLRNFLLHLREATIESKIAPSQVLSMCQLCFADKTMMTLRALMKQGTKNLRKFPNKTRPHPLQYAVARLSSMLPTKHMWKVDLMEDFWSMDLSLPAFLPNRINTTIAQLSQLALLAYEGRPQHELDEIIKIKVVLSIPKEVRLILFQHEAARLSCGDKLLSEQELYDFMRFLAGRGSRGGFRPDPLRARRTQPPDFSNHGVLRTFATARKIQYEDVCDEIALIDINEHWSCQQVPEENPEPKKPDFQGAMEAWYKHQEDLLRTQVDLIRPINKVAQTLIDQMQQQPLSHSRAPLNANAVASMDYDSEGPHGAPMLEYNHGDQPVATVNEVTRDRAPSAASQTDDIEKSRGKGKRIYRSDNSWDIYHRTFKEQNTYRDTQGFRKFWDEQVKKVGQTPWWPAVSGPCPKDLQNRFISDMNRYPRDNPILYKAGERVLVAKTFILHYAEHKASFCCGRTNCSMITCPATGSSQVLHFCDNCEIGFHSSHSCKLVAKNEADLPRN